MKTVNFPSFSWFTRFRGKLAPKVPQLGLCLSSGAARGLSHVGVIQVLEEEHIPIAAIAGSSMGAYVGSLWAAGFNGQQLEKLAGEIKDRRTLLKLLDFAFPPSAGLVKGERIRQHLERSLGSVTFEELRTPMIAIATDLDSLSPVVFDKGSVSNAVHASIAIPGVCAPVMINGRRFTDGGASEPLPVDAMRKQFHLDHVIAVNLVPTPHDLACTGANVPRQPSRNPFRWLNLLAYGNVLDTFHRSLLAAQMQVAAKEARHADVLIRPVFDESKWYDFENFDRYIKAGRHAAINALPEIKALMNQTLPTREGRRYETAYSSTDMGFLAA